MSPQTWSLWVDASLPAFIELELEELEAASAKADSLLTEEHRDVRVELDGDRNGGEDRQLEEPEQLPRGVEWADQPAREVGLFPTPVRSTHEVDRRHVADGGPVDEHLARARVERLDGLDERGLGIEAAAALVARLQHTNARAAAQLLQTAHQDAAVGRFADDDSASRVPTHVGPVDTVQQPDAHQRAEQEEERERREDGESPRP